MRTNDYNYDDDIDDGDNDVEIDIDGDETEDTDYDPEDGETADGDDGEGEDDGDTDGDGDGDEADGDDDGESEDGDSDSGLPRGVQKRFSKLVAKAKKAQARAEAAEAELSELREKKDIPAATLASVVKRHGILGGLLTADEVKKLEEADSLRMTVDFIESKLDEMEDDGQTEAEIDGQSWTRGQLRGELRKRKNSLKDIDDDARELSKRLRDRTARIVKLGLAEEKRLADEAKKGGTKKKSKPKADAPGRRLPTAKNRPSTRSTGKPVSLHDLIAAQVSKRYDRRRLSR